MAGQTALRFIQVNRLSAAGCQHFINALDVATRIKRRNIVLIPRREDIAIGSKQAWPLIDAIGVNELIAQFVGPCDHDVSNSSFNFLNADAWTFGGGRVNDDVNAGQCGIRDLHAGVGRRSGERVDEYALDFSANQSCVFFAGVGRWITGLIWFLTGGLFFIGAIVDLFLIPGQVQVENLSQQLLRQAMGPGSGAWVPPAEPAALQQ